MLRLRPRNPWHTVDPKTRRHAPHAIKWSYLCNPTVPWPTLPLAWPQCISLTSMRAVASVLCRLGVAGVQPGDHVGEGLVA